MFPPISHPAPPAQHGHSGKILRWAGEAQGKLDRSPRREIPSWVGVLGLKFEVAMDLVFMAVGLMVAELLMAGEEFVAM